MTSKPDSYSRHEVLHMAYFYAETFDNYITNHPAVEANPALFDAACKIVRALSDFYQLVGNENDKADDE